MIASLTWNPIKKTCILWAAFQTKDGLRLGQNVPNAGVKAASKEMQKAAFHKRTKVMMA